MKTLVSLLVVGSILTATPVFAGPAATALSACLADNTTGKDRKDLARWVFVGMASHPEIQSLSKATSADQNEANQTMAAMIMRLMTENCRDQARALIQQEGPAAFPMAFSPMGQLAMQELIANPEVKASFEGFLKYLNQKKLNSVFLKK